MRKLAVWTRKKEEFVFVPGDTVTLGWEQFAVGLNQESREELEYLFREWEMEQKMCIRDSPMAEKELALCDECGSLFFKGSSQMMALCPECAYVLYGYPNCEHNFHNGRCMNCYWDGSKSAYIKKPVSYTHLFLLPERSMRT